MPDRDWPLRSPTGRYRDRRELFKDCGDEAPAHVPTFSRRLDEIAGKQSGPLQPFESSVKLEPEAESALGQYRRQNFRKKSNRNLSAAISSSLTGTPEYTSTSPSLGRPTLRASALVAG